MKRRIISLIIALFLLLALTACANVENDQMAESSVTETDTGVKQENKLPAPGTNASVLDGKKVIFVGCSYTYYGYIVHQGAMYQDSQNKVLSQEERSNDQAFFYQLCKANGAEVSVTDWTFGGHDLTDLFDGHCDADRGHDGYNHLEDLVDREFDYVILQEIQVPGGWTPERYLQNVKEIMDFFREANPDVKFFYTIHDGVYTQNYNAPWKKSIRLIEEAGVTIIDWGTLAWDVWTGVEEVPGAEQPYNKNSFIVSRVEGDGYHPNPLSGYLNTLMTYCAITGETAVGQPYSFCTSEPDMLEKFKRSYYRWDDRNTEEDERKTNFVEILSSEADMKGLQTLADRYLEEDTKVSAEYTVTFKNDDGSVIKENTLRYGDKIPAPAVDPRKPGETSDAYSFVGWDKEIGFCVGNETYTAVFEKK